MKTFFIGNNSEELILFFLGWGMDERPMLPFKSVRDILYFYDYSDLMYNFDFSKYKKIYLVGYSAGVSVGAYLSLPEVEYSVAINGTFDLCDEQFGLSSEIIKVFRNINLNNYMNFRRNYLVTSDEELELFNKNEPYRSVESSMQELDALEKYDFSKINFHYDKVYVSKEDKIFPINRQKDFWQEKCNIISGGHFSLYNFSSIDEILEM